MALWVLPARATTPEATPSPRAVPAVTHTPSVIVRLGLAYDGTGFRGWARNSGQRTVEGVLSDALARVLGDAPKLSVAGRTDAGVHARGQVASFVVGDDVGLERLQRSVNGMLAPEVVAWEVRRAAEGFDARFSATAREYRYRIDTGPWPDPFEARFVWHRAGSLAVARMREAARPLLGEHDFTSFCRRPQSGGTVRRLERVSIARAGDRVEISARANAFLHQMVRALVGTLIAVGDGRLEPGSAQEILRARDRSRTPQMAPAHGLTLERVIYGRRD
jgi:tRNA pseudouridine38-40 synthase